MQLSCSSGIVFGQKCKNFSLHKFPRMNDSTEEVTDLLGVKVVVVW